MRIVFDVSALLAVLVLGYLLYLILFERGPLYRTSRALHGLDDDRRLELLSAVLATPVQSLHSFCALQEGELYDSQLDAIRAARRSIHLEAYIFFPGRVADALLKALSERASAGVQVRVVIDAIGSLRTRARLFAPLIAAGGQVQRYHPLHLHMFRRWNSRTHRNLLVIDGEVGFIGGAGVADHWSPAADATWRDCVLRVTGPVVTGLQAVFIENWLESEGELLVGPEAFAVHGVEESRTREEIAPGLAIGSTPTAGRSTRARVLVQFLLATARDSIDLCSPYFIPDLGLRRELTAARARGVRVRILTGGPYSDHGLVRRAGRRRYRSLLEAGVEIWEYSPRMMHAKVLLVDGRWVLVGSTNIDNRSFGLNDEVNLLVRSENLERQLKAMFEADIAHSKLFDLAAWRGRSLVERVLATLGRVLERHQ